MTVNVSYGCVAIVRNGEMNSFFICSVPICLPQPLYIRTLCKSIKRSRNDVCVRLLHIYLTQK